MSSLFVAATCPSSTKELDASTLLHEVTALPVADELSAAITSEAEATQASTEVEFDGHSGDDELPTADTVSR